MCYTSVPLHWVVNHDPGLILELFFLIDMVIIMENVKDGSEFAVDFSPAHSGGAKPAQHDDDLSECTWEVLVSDVLFNLTNVGNQGRWWRVEGNQFHLDPFNISARPDPHLYFGAVVKATHTARTMFRLFRTCAFFWSALAQDSCIFVHLNTGPDFCRGFGCWILRIVLWLKYEIERNYQAYKYEMQNQTTISAPTQIVLLCH